MRTNHHRNSCLEVQGSNESSKFNDLDDLFDVVIGLEFGGADVEVDVPLAVLRLRCEEVSGQLPNLLRPGGRPHQHLIGNRTKKNVQEVKLTRQLTGSLMHSLNNFC